MGGIAISTETGEEFISGSPRLHLTVEGAKFLAHAGYLPDIPDSDIWDKSKADTLGKTIVCLQASWMILHLLGRLVARLPITLLEINTFAHVLCALAIYILWWKKPMDVNEPVLLSDENWVRPLAALMWACSRSEEPKCYHYHPPDMEDEIRIWIPRQTELSTGETTQSEDSLSGKIHCSEAWG